MAGGKSRPLYGIDLKETAEREGIRKTAMILIGNVLGTREENGYADSRLYAPDFTTGFRKGTERMKKLYVVGMGRETTTP